MINDTQKCVLSTRTAIINDEVTFEFSLHLMEVEDLYVYSIDNQGIYIRLLLEKNKNEGVWDCFTCISNNLTDSFTCYDEILTPTNQTPSWD